LRLKRKPELQPGELWPACLPTKLVQSYEGKIATVVGWGRTEGKSGTSARFVKFD